MPPEDRGDGTTGAYDPSGDIGDAWGAFFGGDAGVLIGEAIGTLFAPGVGTLIGGLIGGYVGSVIGGAAGRAAGDYVNNASGGRVNNYLSNTTSGQILTKGLEAAPGIINDLRMVIGPARGIEEMTGGGAGGRPGSGALRNLAEDGEGNLARRGLNTEGGALEENTGNAIESGSGSGGAAPNGMPLRRLPGPIEVGPGETPIYRRGSLNLPGPLNFGSHARDAMEARGFSEFDAYDALENGEVFRDSDPSHATFIVTMKRGGQRFGVPFNPENNTVATFLEKVPAKKPGAWTRVNEPVWRNKA